MGNPPEHPFPGTAVAVGAGDNEIGILVQRKHAELARGIGH